ncbi:MAG: TetR/AcrR family transcriptional regulator [Lachnospiraceae bacterium]|nr:TetR/AcrR family transcriptional regulator [Lachnospiraceae bacterium]
MAQTDKAFQAKINIFEATVRLLADNDYSSLTMRRICEAAGISNGTLYHYFKSKNDILAFSLRYIYETFLTNYNTESLMPQERVLELYVYVARRFMEFGLGFVSNFMDIRNQALNIDYLLQSEEDGMIAAFFMQSLQGVKDSGCLKQGTEVRKIYDDLNVIFYGALFYWGLCGGHFDLESYMRSIIEIHFNQYLMPACKLK